MRCDENINVPDPGDTSTTDTSTASIDLLDLDQLVTIYPNPANDHLTVKLDQGFEGDVHITLINSLGQTVQDQVRLISGAKTRTTFNVAQEPAGVYYIKVIGNGVQWARPVVLRH